MLQADLEEISKTVCKKGKPLFNQIGLKIKRAIRKGYTSYSLFHFWDLKLVPIDSALNFVSSKLTHSFQKCRCGTKKAAKLENAVQILQRKR